MRQQIEVVYQNGVLHPLGLLPQLQENERVTVTIEHGEDLMGWLADAEPSVTLESVRQALAKTSSTMAQLVREEREDR